MRAMTSSIRRRARVLALVGLSALMAVLLFSTRVYAQGFIDWTGDGDGFATFGPNEAVTIVSGQAQIFFPGCSNPLQPATNIYVVNVSSLSDGAALVDVSNSAGTPNTAFLFGGGGLGDETIAYTAPSGFLGTGTYGVVFDNCQDGKFDAGYTGFRWDCPYGA